MCSTIMYTISAALIFIRHFFPFFALEQIYPYHEPDKRFLYMQLSVEAAFIITTVGPIIIELRLY